MLHSSLMKLKVQIDFMKSLKHGWKVRSSNGEWVSIVFKYERLGAFHFACGVLEHTNRTCEKLLNWTLMMV